MAILSEACKSDNFKSHDSLKLSFTNIRGLRSNFVDCESFLESNSPDILALYETNLDGLACSLYEGKTSFCTDVSLENSADSYLCFRLALLHSVSYSFFLY